MADANAKTPIPLPVRQKGRWTALALGLVVLCVYVAYLNTFFKGEWVRNVPVLAPLLKDLQPAALVFDDLGSIVDNPTIRNLRDIRTVLKADMPLGDTVRGRPLLNLSLAVNYAISNLDPWSYHLFNVTIHALAAMVLLGLVLRTLRLPSMRARFGRHALPLATATALLWGLHSLNTQAITYTVQRAEAMMSLLFLLTMFFLAVAAESRRKWAWYSCAVVTCLAGMVTKEVMAVAPVVAFLYDWIFLSGSPKKAIKARPLFYGALAATWVVLWVVVRGARGESAGFNAELPIPPSWGSFGEYISTHWPRWAITATGYYLTQFWAITRYLCLAAWPSGITFDYGSEWVAPLNMVIIPGLVVAALLALTGIALWKRPKAGFLAAVFFIVLAPTSIVPVVTQPVAEHRMYLPLAALVTLAVVSSYALGRFLWRRWKLPAGAGWAGGAVVVALVAGSMGTMTHERNYVFRSDLTLWRDTIRKFPINMRAYNNAASQLMGMYRPPDVDILYEAIGLLNKAVKLRDKYADAHYNLGLCYQALGNWRLAASEFTRSSEIDPKAVVSYSKRSECYRMLRQMDLARQDCSRAIEIDPNFALAYYNRGLCWQMQNEFRAAIADYDRAIAIGWPSVAQAYNSRGTCWSALEEYNSAIKDLGEAIRLFPEYAEAYNTRGTCLAAVGLLREAVEDYGRAIALAPQYGDAYNNRGVAWKDLKEYQRSLEDYDRAIALKPNYARAYSNRAQVHFLQGHYDQAWADVELVQRLGFAVDPDLIKELSRATGRGK